MAIFVPIRVLVNFINGGIAGGVQRVGSLVPLMIAHLILDMWNFALLDWIV